MHTNDGKYIHLHLSFHPTVWFDSNLELLSNEPHILGFVHYFFYFIIFRLQEIQMNWDVHGEGSWEAENIPSYLLLIIFLPRKEKAHM